MKPIVVLFSILIISASIHAQKSAVKPVFLVQELPAVVEGMTYDPVGEHFYFGNSKGYHILRYTKAGKPAGYIDGAKDGMTSVLGIIVSKEKRELWACGAITVDGKKTRCVFQYDLGADTLIGKYPDASGKAQLFNDVAITSDGGVYITESYTKSLYKVDVDAKVTRLYLQSDTLDDGNGLTANGHLLYMSTSKGVTQIDTKSNQLSVVSMDNLLPCGHDGLYYYKNSLIGIQNVYYPKMVARYYLTPDGSRIAKGEVLAADDPSFGHITTGAIVGDDFYFMSNNNIRVKDPAHKIVVSKIALK